jgi:hypothetical protein
MALAILVAPASPMLLSFDVGKKHRKEKILTSKVEVGDGLIAFYGIGYFGCPCISNVVDFLCW